MRPSQLYLHFPRPEHRKPQEAVSAPILTRGTGRPEPRKHPETHTLKLTSWLRLAVEIYNHFAVVNCCSLLLQLFSWSLHFPLLLLVRSLLRWNYSYCAAFAQHQATFPRCRLAHTRRTLRRTRPCKPRCEVGFGLVTSTDIGISDVGVSENRRP